MNGFHRVSLKPRVFTREFRDTVKTEKTFAFTRTTFPCTGLTPIKYYRANGNEYMYCTDKTLRRISDEGSYSVFTSDVIPIVLPIIRSGQRTVMIISDVNAKVGARIMTGLPYGRSGAYFCGRVFIADGYDLKYTAEFDFVNFTTGVDFGGSIKMDKDDGEIMHLLSDGNKLYIICRRTAYSLTAFGKSYEFSLEKVSSFGLNVAENSAESLGGCAYFISGKDLCVLTGGKIKRVGSMLRSFADYTLGVGGGYESTYIIPFASGGRNYLYAFDGASGEEVLREITDYTVAGAVAVKSDGDRVYRTGITGGTTITGENYSGEYDFGSCAKKSICRIEAHISGSCCITVTGDGSFSATLTEKCNSVPCFLHGTSFAVNVSDASEDFKLHKLAIHYVSYGE